VAALPTAIPESIVHDVSTLSIGDTVLLEAIAAPPGVTLLGDLQEVVIATLSPPRLRNEEELEVELETELVGEGEEGAPATAGEAEDAAGDGDASTE
jgi:hypothetical protein